MLRCTALCYILHWIALYYSVDCIGMHCYKYGVYCIVWWLWLQGGTLTNSDFRIVICQNVQIRNWMRMLILLPICWKEHITTKHIWLVWIVCIVWFTCISMIKVMIRKFAGPGSRPVLFIKKYLCQSFLGRQAHCKHLANRQYNEI